MINTPTLYFFTDLYSSFGNPYKEPNRHRSANTINGGRNYTRLFLRGCYTGRCSWLYGLSTSLPSPLPFPFAYPFPSWLPAPLSKTSSYYIISTAISSTSGVWKELLSFFYQVPELNWSFSTLDVSRLCNMEIFYRKVVNMLALR